MKVNALSSIFLGTVLTVGGITSCTYNNYDKNAKKEALQYLDEFQAKQAERMADTQDDKELHLTPVTYYWDNVLLQEKIKQAYGDGLNYVKDSADNKYTKEKTYPLNLNKQYKSSRINDRIREELSDMLNTKEFNNYVSNEPNPINRFRLAGGCSPAQLHYWYQIIIKNKEKEAFEKGKADMREMYLNK